MRHQRYPEAPRQPEKAVTCGENQAARNQTVDAPSVHQQNARWKTPVHAHGASNHTMDTTGTCHPQKLRWHALTWKPTAKMSIRHRRNKRCVTIPQMPHKTHAHKTDLVTNLVNFLPLGKHDFVPNELRTLPKTHRTRNMRHMRQKKKSAATLRRRRAFITSHVRSTNKDVSELVLHVQSWPRAARRKTQGTETDDTNAAREHHNMTGLWRTGHCDNRLTNRHSETSHRTPKNTTEKNQMSRAFAPRLVLVCARIFRSGAFVHNQRGHDARPRMTEHPRTVCRTSQRTRRC